MHVMSNMNDPVWTEISSATTNVWMYGLIYKHRHTVWGSLSPSVAKESLFSSCADVPDETFMLLAGRHKSKMIEIATFLQQTVHKLCSLPTVVTHLLSRGALWNMCVSEMDTSNLSFSEYCNSCQHSQQTSPNCLQTLLPPSVPG